MKHIEVDFTYIDRMLEKRRKEHALGRLTAYAFSDMYWLVLNYWRIYWQGNAEREDYLLTLVAEIEYLYNMLYPNELPILDNRNTRDAGRPRQYDKEFNDRIMEFVKEGCGPTAIAKKVGCSKSYVSKLRNAGLNVRKNSLHLLVKTVKFRLQKP